jgi:protein involved in polysaccharide export with SLBB domain
MKKVLHTAISKYVPDFQMNITMQGLRTIKVYIVGNVHNPGSYTLSSLSTMINALFACGGPTKQGTLRRIKLIRNGKTINTLDLYNFLLKGDKSQDERLQPGDTIFVPIIAEVVGIAGNVKRPAIYEMKEKLVLEDLIELAGGVTPIGFLQRVQVVDLDLSSSKPESDSQWQIPLQDGDVVKIYPIHPTTNNIVYLEGHVTRPGGYELKKSMRISDLIRSFNDLMPEPHLEYGEIIRLEEPDFYERAIPFNLGKVLKKNPKDDLKLQRFDRIKIYSKLDFKDKYNITILGQVRRPGKYRVFPNMRVKDLVEIAGGVLDNTYLQKSELTRRIIDEGKNLTTHQLNINIGKAMAEDEEHNILVQKYDVLKIQVIPEWRMEASVFIEGEIRFPGKYPLKKSEKLSSIIQRAGGYTDRAYLRGVVFTRESAKELQRKNIEDLIYKMEIEIQATAATITREALDKEDIAAAQQVLATQKELLKKLKTAKVTGRVVIILQPLEKLIESKYDIELEDGDRLVIPPEPGIVEVLGEVYNPSAILHQDDRTVEYYLDKVGGLTEDADEDRVYLVKSDGSVISRSQEGIFGLLWDAENNRWSKGGLMSTKVQPGDVILAPRKIEEIRWLKNTSDLVQILYQTAIAAGVMVAIF